MQFYYIFAKTTLQAVKQLVAILTLISLLLSCTRPAHRHRFHAAEQLLLQEDTAVWSTLDSLKQQLPHFSKADRMHSTLLLTDAHNKFDHSLAADSLMQEVVRYYDAHGNTEQRIRANYLLGCVYRDRGDAPYALEFYRKAVELADTTRTDCNYHRLCRICRIVQPRA